MSEYADTDKPSIGTSVAMSQYRGVAKVEEVATGYGHLYYRPTVLIDGHQQPIPMAPYLTQDDAVTAVQVIYPGVQLVAPVTFDTLRAQRQNARWYGSGSVRGGHHE